MTIKRWTVVVLAASVLGAAFASAAPKKTVDTFWLHPEFRTFHVRRLSLFPATTYDNSFDTERVVDQATGAAVSGSRYSWLSPASTRDMLREESPSDSLLKALRAGIVKNGRLDSLAAPAVCRLLHVNAVLTTRVDRWDRQELAWNQSGRPSTSVGLTAALVDSAGRLLWRAQGSQSLDGPYVEAEQTEIDPTRRQVSGHLGPDPLEPLQSLLDRWKGQFPSRADVDSAGAATK